MSGCVRFLQVPRRSGLRTAAAPFLLLGPKRLQDLSLPHSPNLTYHWCCWLYSGNIQNPSAIHHLITGHYQPSAYASGQGGPLPHTPTSHTHPSHHKHPHQQMEGHNKTPSYLSPLPWELTGPCRSWPLLLPCPPALACTSQHPGEFFCLGFPYLTYTPLICHTLPTSL